MGLTLKTRIERLEQATQPENAWAFVLVEVGEDEDQAIALQMAANGLRRRPENIFFVVR